MKKKKVLILVGIPHFDYSDEKSAVLSWLNQIKSAFEEVGYEVVFADSYEGKISKSISVEKNKKSLVEVVKSVMKKWPWLYYSLVFRKYFSAQNEMSQQIIDRHSGIDLVIEFHAVGSLVGLEVAKHFNASFSVIFDSPVDEQFVEMHGTKSMYWKRICESERSTLEAADKVMVYSQACEDHIRSKYNIKAKVNQLPSALNKPVDEIVRNDGGNFNIGFIGSFLVWHKVDLLVKVFEKFHAKYSKSNLILLGYGEQWLSIKKQIEKSPAKDAIKLPGFVSEEELIEFKSQFTIATMPGSNWYGSPLKLFEYSRAGIPFIAPVSKTVSCIYEDGVHCLYVKEEDEEGSLFKALETMYLQPKLRNDLGRQANEMIERYYNKSTYFGKLIKNLS